MVGWIARWRQRGRIRRVVRLRGVLRGAYGASDIFTRGQVETAAGRRGLGAAHMPLAYAIFCSQAEFAAAGVTGDYHELREQVDALLLAGSGFAGHEGITDPEAARIGGTPDGGGGDGGNGGGGD